MLTAHDLKMSLSGTPVLDQVSLQLAAGQVMVILGPNGTGKTTLLKVLTGELTPDDGAVQFQQQPLKQWSAAARAQRLAVLPQHSTLNFPFTAREVVLLGRSAHSSGQVRDRAIVDSALALVDGSYLAERFYTQLSGGEKQRVQLARVLAQIWEPPSDGLPGDERFLVLDEPTSSFDLSHRQLMLDVIKHFAKQGVGVLMVSHDLNLAAQCADQVMLLSCGHVAACGDCDTVLREPLLRDVFMADIEVVPHPSTGQSLIIY
ncbi:heme ABC transporter ATP-binding protein [Porticoccus sp. W117]|uniref:heme ABC transporter ATP-binding protein n=1 Tax=Porticoccus sp. W117 TaxID=3054777 RepID=UPI0025931507|nr:heme ABC transporter ATP-binding protein [Porticoccus sp. W117]MDM3871417.1 heme ABC transporter ATP-binding protein [Porticoccus sp. W117]